MFCREILGFICFLYKLETFTENEELNRFNAEIDHLYCVHNDLFLFGYVVTLVLKFLLYCYHYHCHCHCHRHRHRHRHRE